MLLLSSKPYYIVPASCPEGINIYSGSNSIFTDATSYSFFSYSLFFSVIGDLAFGSPFGMIEKDGADIVAITTESGDVIHSAAVQILNERGEFSATQGALPVWVRPYTKYYDPWFARGGKSVTNLAGVSL